MKCENCNIEHDGSYGSGRFCSIKCARGYSTKVKREEINEKVARTLSKDGLTSEERKRAKHAAYEREAEVKNILDISPRTIRKIFKRMKLACSSCGFDKCYGDLHHIIPKSEGGSDDNSNLTYVCPNCHRMAHENKIADLVNIEDYIGDTWKEYYYVRGKGKRTNQHN